MNQDRPGVGYVLAHEQFPSSELIEIGVAAEDAGFDSARGHHRTRSASHSASRRDAIVAGAHREPLARQHRPADHVEHIRALQAAGATDVDIHAPQPEQDEVLSFYKNSVGP